MPEDAEQQEQNRAAWRPPAVQDDSTLVLPSSGKDSGNGARVKRTLAPRDVKATPRRRTSALGQSTDAASGARQAQQEAGSPVLKAPAADEEEE